MVVSSETCLLPAPPTARADHAMSPPFIRRFWRLSVLIHLHGHLCRSLAFAHSQTHFTRANILIHAVGHLFQLDERGDGLEQGLVVRERIARRHHQARRGDAELSGDLRNFGRDRGLGVRDAKGAQVRRLVRALGGGAHGHGPIRALDAIQCIF